MPTILRTGPYRFFFYSGDCSEPPHIHVERERFVGKFWLSPIRLQESGGFSRRELNVIQRIIDSQQSLFMRSWNEHRND
jgi:hypothetical protein